MRPLVLYHGNCVDGFTAAWAVWRALGDRAEYREVFHGQLAPIEDTVGRRVIIVDFSYPRDVLEVISANARWVEVYDHHVTAQRDLDGWEPAHGHVVFDMHRSGAGIAWDEFHLRHPRPRLVNYIEDRDLWRWQLESSREIAEYIMWSPRTFAQWDRAMTLLECAFREAVRDGSALVRAKDVRVAGACKAVRWLDFDGTQIPVVNASFDFSEIGERLCQLYPEAPAGGYYFDRADKRQWGFRSRGDFDVSEFCERYGGGGHKSAAGFTSEIGWLP